VNGIAANSKQLNLEAIYWEHVDAVERLVRLGFSLPEQGCVLPGIGEPQDQRDVVQEVFVRAFAPTARPDPSLPLRPYLLRIAKNLLIDRARRKKRDAIKLPQLQSEIENHVDGPEEADSPEFQAQAKLVADFVATLPEPDKTVIHKRFVDGLSQYEVADALQLTRGKVRAIEESVRKKLQPKLATARRSGMKQLTVLLVFFFACTSLPRNAKTGCDVDADCSNGRYCVANKCQDDKPLIENPTIKTDAGKTCGTHFDCSAQTICVKHKCSVFAETTYEQVVAGFYAGYCGALAEVCSDARMQRQFGTDAVATCVKQTKAMYGTYGLFGAPAASDKIDKKMAAACIADLRVLSLAGRADQTFGNLPLSCSRMNPGALADGADCYMAQAQCKLGSSCAFGPSLDGADTKEFFCLKAFAKVDQDCVTSDGQLLTDCDDGLFCSTTSGKCERRIALNVACDSSEPCPGTDGSPRCAQKRSSAGSQCVFGAQCEDSKCVEHVKECPLP